MKLTSDNAVRALRELTHTYRFTAPAEPARVFPLLCPTREHEWIPTWRCELLHSTSGFAEQGCVFRTDLSEGGTMTWVVSRYEPPTCVGFTCFVADRYVMRLDIALTPVNAGTQLTWTRRFLALAETDVAPTSAGALDSKMAALERLLVHFVRTGAALQP